MADTKKIKEGEFVDLPSDGRERYSTILEKVRKNSVGNKAGMWAFIGEYDNVASARDASARLTREHTKFEFTSRSKGDGTGGRVYARFVG